MSDASTKARRLRILVALTAVVFVGFMIGYCASNLAEVVGFDTPSGAGERAMVRAQLGRTLHLQESGNIESMFVHFKGPDGGSLQLDARYHALIFEGLEAALDEGYVTHGVFLPDIELTVVFKTPKGRRYQTVFARSSRRMLSSQASDVTYYLTGDDVWLPLLLNLLVARTLYDSQREVDKEILFARMADSLTAIGKCSGPRSVEGYQVYTQLLAECTAIIEK